MAKASAATYHHDDFNGRIFCGGCGSVGVAIKLFIAARLLTPIAVTGMTFGMVGLAFASARPPVRYTPVIRKCD